jgi:hypothetical protein
LVKKIYELNPQMTQMNADGEEEKQGSWEWEHAYLAAISMITSDRQAVGTTSASYNLRQSASSADDSRRFEAQLANNRS